MIKGTAEVPWSDVVFEQLIYFIVIRTIKFASRDDMENLRLFSKCINMCRECVHGPIPCFGNTKKCRGSRNKKSIQKSGQRMVRFTFIHSLYLVNPRLLSTGCTLCTWTISCQSMFNSSLPNHFAMYPYFLMAFEAIALFLSGILTRTITLMRKKDLWR